MRAALSGAGIDDAYISFRYAENLSQGHGLVFNVGERVEGYSNLLWILILAPFARRDLTPVAEILGLGCCISTLLLAVWGLRRVLRVQSGAAAAFVALLLASSGYFAAWSVAGMESGLHALLLLAAWLRGAIEFQAEKPKRPLSALLFGALAMTRPEGALVALAAVIVHLIASRGRGWAPSSRRTLAFPILRRPGHEKWDVNYTLRVVQPDIIIEANRIREMGSNPIFKEWYTFVPGWRLLDVRVKRAQPKWDRFVAPPLKPSGRDSTSARQPAP